MLIIYIVDNVSAEHVDQNGRNSWRLLVIILIITAMSVILLGILIYYLRRRFPKSTGNFFGYIYFPFIIIVSIVQNIGYAYS